MKLYIMRHGNTSWNRTKKLQGRKDILLAEEGIALAKEVGEALNDVEFDLVISSPLMRAKQTAELVMAGRQMPMLTDRRLTEMSFGLWEGEEFDTSEKITDEFREKFSADPMNCPAAPRGETFSQVLKRTEDFYQSLINNKAYEDKIIFISTHGAASRCLLANFFEDKTDIWRGGVPANCSVTIVNVENGVGAIEEMDKIFYNPEHVKKSW